jgi:hypothetical protein
MSWQDQLNNVSLQITTGDGEVYLPKWLNAKKNVRFNTEGFEFIGVDGTFVDRKEQSGQQFPIELHFDGINCTEDAAKFLESAKDKRPWTLKHPFYGEILVQPISLSIDDSLYNDSVITGILWETIRTKFPEDVLVVEDVVGQLKADSDLLVSRGLTNKILSPDIGLITPAGNAITNIEKNYKNLAVLSEDAKLLKDLARTASGAAQNLLDDLDGYITATIALINFPFQIVQTLESKIEKVKDSIDELFSIFNQEDDQEQSLYESLATSSLTEFSRLVVVPESDDYNTRVDVLNTFDLLNNTYVSVLENFDSTGYIQDSDLALNLDLIINFSLSNLYEIAFEARQERIVNIEKDSNIVLLAHRYYGTGDDSLQEFIDQNNISVDEYLIVKKGREIIYYV